MIGQRIQQRFVGRRVTDSDIIHRFHNAAARQLGPDAAQKGLVVAPVGRRDPELLQPIKDKLIDVIDDRRIRRGETFRRWQITSAPSVKRLNRANT